jgi:hypothetical protein
MNTHIFMVDQFHEHKFPIRSFGMGNILEGPAKFFNGNILLFHSVVGSTEKRKIEKTLLNIPHVDTALVH